MKSLYEYRLSPSTPMTLVERIPNGERSGTDQEIMCKYFVAKFLSLIMIIHGDTLTCDRPYCRCSLSGFISGNACGGCGFDYI